MAHRLIKPGSEPLDTANLTAGTIRNMIDSFGFSLEGHESVPSIQPIQEVVPMANGFTSSIKFVPGPGFPGFPSIDPLIVPGGVPSTINIPALIRDAINIFTDKTPDFFQAPEGPLVLPPGSPTPGVFPPGGFQNGFPPQQRSGGRAAFITMPNGLPGCPSGYHPEKQGQPYCVRNRRMNPLNPRALSRATRRVGGFARAVKRARTLKKICKTL